MILLRRSSKTQHTLAFSPTVTKPCSTLLRRVWSCQDVTSPSQPCHEGPPTWTDAPVPALYSLLQLPNLAAPSSRGVQPGQGLSLNRRHLPVVSIAQLSVISHSFLNLFTALWAHEAQQAEGKTSQPRGPEHHTATLFICKCLFATFTFHISLLTRQLKDIWKHFITFLNNVNKH